MLEIISVVLYQLDVSILGHQSFSRIGLHFRCSLLLTFFRTTEVKAASDFDGRVAPSLFSYHWEKRQEELKNNNNLEPAATDAEWFSVRVRTNVNGRGWKKWCIARLQRKNRSKLAMKKYFLAKAFCELRLKRLFWIIIKIRTGVQW